MKKKNKVWIHICVFIQEQTSLLNHQESLLRNLVDQYNRAGFQKIKELFLHIVKL
ncbi:hypothetical protein [Thomasclavelia cocleata]|uniref:hypothetical protein n=1 Tax=Thomasclavelia cocleata TaxID=69824 RepID=UPI00242CD2D2|nr:hypothetical protein [Thomasclavelia cocleata]